MIKTFEEITEQRTGRAPVPTMKFKCKHTANPKEVNYLGFQKEFNCYCNEKIIRDKHTKEILFHAITKAGFPAPILKRIV